MQQSIQVIPLPEKQIHVRLVVESFDCAEDCSLEHWVQVCQLVDDGDEIAEGIDVLVARELESTAWN